MKKCLYILPVLCSLSFPLRAFEEDAIEHIKPIAVQRFMGYFVGHHALIHHCYGLFYEGISVIKEGVAKLDQVAAQYPNEKNEVERTRFLLQRQDFLVKSLGFMTLGFYERHAQLDEQDLKTVQLQILMRLFQQIEMDRAVKQGKLNKEGARILLQGQECTLMKEVREFCQSSSDPFFSHQLYPLIKDFNSRADILEYYFGIWLDEVWLVRFVQILLDPEGEEEEEPMTEAGRALIPILKNKVVNLACSFRQKLTFRSH